MRQRWTVARSNASREALCNRYPKLGRTIGLRDMLQDILADEDQEALRRWCKRAKRSRLEAFRELARHYADTDNREAHIEWILHEGDGDAQGRINSFRPAAVPRFR